MHEKQTGNRRTIIEIKRKKCKNRELNSAVE